MVYRYEVTVNGETVYTGTALAAAFQAMRDNAVPGDEVRLWRNGKRRHFICARYPKTGAK